MDKINDEINDKTLENVTGGSRGPGGWVCDMCGRNVCGDEIDTYEIRIDYCDPESSEYLGRKDVCNKCRDTHLKEYNAKHGWGYLAGIYMKGPL